MTQQERVLAALAAHPQRGITQVDFSLPHVIDGGPPITRVAARIDDLEKDGHVIRRDGRRDKCVVYKLIPATLSGPADAGVPLPSHGRVRVDQASAPDERGASLFDFPVGRPERNAIFDMDDAA